MSGAASRGCYVGETGQSKQAQGEGSRLAGQGEPGQWHLGIEESCKAKSRAK